MTTKMQQTFTHNSGFFAEPDVQLASFKLASCDLVDDALIRAIRDARQTCDKALQQEALAWLWICCPDIADELGLPMLETVLETDDEKADLPLEIADYLQRYSAFSLIA